MVQKKSITVLLSILMIFGSVVFFNPAVNAAGTNGWVQANGTWYYYHDGIKQKNGWVRDSKGWCSLNAIDGAVVKNGWASDCIGWCFLSDVDGSWVQERWVKDSQGWVYIKNGYWIENATWEKDAAGWQFIGANGYWISTIAPKATNPIVDADAAVEKAEASKLKVDIDVAKALVNELDNAIHEKNPLAVRVAKIISVTP